MQKLTVFQKKKKKVIQENCDFVSQNLQQI